MRLTACTRIILASAIAASTAVYGIIIVQSQEGSQTVTSAQPQTPPTRESLSQLARDLSQWGSFSGVSKLNKAAYQKKFRPLVFTPESISWREETLARVEGADSTTVEVRVNLKEIDPASIEVKLTINETYRVYFRSSNAGGVSVQITLKKTGRVTSQVTHPHDGYSIEVRNKWQAQRVAAGLSAAVRARVVLRELL